MGLFDRYPTLRTVIVNTKTGQAFRGVLWMKRRDLLVLKGAELLKAKGETVPVDGEVVVLADNVDWLQVVSA